MISVGQTWENKEKTKNIEIVETNCDFNVVEIKTNAWIHSREVMLNVLEKIIKDEKMILKKRQ